MKIKYELPQYRFSSFKKYKELAKQYRYVYKLENDLLYKYDTKHDEFHLLPNANIKKFNSFFKKLKSTSKLHIPKENIFCIKLHETLGNGLELGCITRPW
ncbi:MAG: hypothetical protein LBV22_02765 [Mycoplasmataceae bacterium]|nr:hypothetical protein [Mycoplasmataceae bacterium]